jgi:ABC-type uncharacterized transport system involved in gliding motility auxiliary subunit
VDDVLREYQAYSKEKLRVEYIDPAEKPEEEQKLRFLGIPQVQLNVIEKDQLQVINGYLGMAILYADRHQAIPLVQDVYTLEYDLTAGILQVLSEQKRVVGYLTGNQEPELNRDFEALSQVLAKSYEVKPVDLSMGREEVPEDVNTLIVARPQATPARVQYQLDQFLMRGGRIFFLIDPIRLDDRLGLTSPIPVNTGLDEMLAHYGVKLDRALVQDALNENAGFSQGFVRYTVPYPFWPKAMGKGLSAENPVTNRLESVVFPWCAPLTLLVPEAGGRTPARADTAVAETLEKAPQPGVRATVLARSSPRAWLQSGRFDLTPPNPFAGPVRPQEGKESFPLAVALVGTFRSFYEGKPVPPAPGDSIGISGTPGRTESPETQIIVIGNSLFAATNFVSMFPGNEEFALNAIDWLTLGDKLIAIRSRGATDRPLGIESATAKGVFKYAHTFGMAFLVAAFGIVRMTVRRRAKRLATPVHVVQEVAR